MNVGWFDASWIWKLMTLPRIKTFLWQCAHESIGVKTCLMRRGVINDGCCPICHQEAEIVLHALRDCARAKNVWRQLGVQSSNHEFWLPNLQEWLNNNAKLRNNHAGAHIPWKTVFSFAVWNIWKGRNGCVFDRKIQTQSWPWR